MRVYNGLDLSPQLQQQAAQSIQGLYGNCSSLEHYQPQLQPQWVYCQCGGHSNPADYEFRIWQYGTEVRMDYGTKLKILMADPIKGMHLREAVQKLKEALLEIKE